MDSVFPADFSSWAARILWGQHFGGKDQGEHQKPGIVQHHLGEWPGVTRGHQEELWGDLRWISGTRNGND